MNTEWAIVIIAARRTHEPKGRIEMMDYDLSIHTNPDARAWAKFYLETRDAYEAKNPGQRYDDEDMMIGWFANAMMAMHDHIKGGPVVLPDGSAFFVADVPTPSAA